MIQQKWEPTRNTMAAVENSAIYTVCALIPARYVSERELRIATLLKLRNIFKVLRADADKHTQEGLHEY